jgi:formate dehydrogenase major subunit
MDKEGNGHEPKIPAGGWGSLKEVSTILLEEKVPPQRAALLLKQNKPDGFACVSCAWAKPAHPHPAEFCESGAKATAWEVTSKRIDADFFASHTVEELERWQYNDL